MFHIVHEVNGPTGESWTVYEGCFSHGTYPFYYQALGEMEYLKEMCSLDTLGCEASKPASMSGYKSASVPCPAPCCAPVSKKKENTMRESYIENNINATERPSDLSTARDALVDRLRDVRNDKEVALRTAFFIDAPEAPKTATEAIARIVAGKFQPIDATKDEARAEKSYGYTWYKAIDWRTSPKDEAGFDAANAKLREAYQDAKLTIQVLPEVDGLAAFKSFKDFSAVTLN